MHVTQGILAGAVETVRLDLLNEGRSLDKLASSAIASRLAAAIPKLSAERDQAADDLDRAFVINGSDLRIALGALVRRDIPITPGDTARILAEIEVTGATVASERELARALEYFSVAVIHGGSILGACKVRHPAEVARDLFARLTVNAACSAPEPDDDVVDAHIHCEHAPESRAASEVAVMDKVVAALGGYDYDGGRRARRILRWAWDFLTDGDEPPF